MGPQQGTSLQLARKLQIKNRVSLQKISSSWINPHREIVNKIGLYGDGKEALTLFSS
jgi:hypothetical protein